MNIVDFDVDKNLLKDKSGLVITPDKSYLLETRLTPVAKTWGYGSLEALTQALQGVPEKDLVNDVVEAMTTNETSFFRDSRPFEVFENFVLPYMTEKRGVAKKLRIWSAAASSGQEPYSLSMLLKDKMPGFSSWQVQMLGTDISYEILDQAKQGIYSQFEVQRGLPIQLLMKYFMQDDDKWIIKDEIKKLVEYKYFNLLDDMTSLGKFDIIFCRNVLIYFDPETKGKVLDKMAKQLEPDGFLFLGGAETVMNITEAFKPMPDQRGLYILAGGPHDKAASGSQPLANSPVSA